VSDELPLLTLAGTIADGAPVDWQCAPDSASSDEDRELLGRRFASSRTSEGVNIRSFAHSLNSLINAL